MSEDLRKPPETAASEPPDPATAPPQKQAKQPRANPYAHLFRLLHWILPVSMVAGMITGFSLHAVARPDWSLFSGVLPSWLPSGRIQIYHLAAAVVSAAGVIAVFVLYWQRRRRRRAIHVILLLAGATLVGTGLVMLHPPQPAWIYSVSRTLHFATGLVILPIALLWHFGEGLVRFPRMLIPIFHPWASPQPRQLLAFLPLLILSAVFILNVLPTAFVGRQLTVKRISASDADLAMLPWDSARPLVIPLADGAGFDHGRTQVALQALHDGEEIFVRAQWADPTEDRQYQPWQKTEDGWKQLVTVDNDESYYYEDKFALIFPTQRSWQFETFGCAAPCHAGVGEGHAYGSKGFDTVIDVWHWKATRTDPVGQIDDKYWSKLEEGGEGGRHGDPKQGGGYEKNAPKGGSRPAFLPATAAAVKQGGLFADQAVSYESAEAAALLDQMRPETIVPGIVFSPFQGDRGDVQCRSTHNDGRWELLIRRKLDTGSQFDTPFVPGRTYSFGCAAFDHTSKRHAYGLVTYGMKLEE
ncbi:MAG: hypothetical protein GXX96_18915 [Planctomycetaceae bacterium]|nr:hypothetical protein [Planctomycetaceae bacterium]